MTFVFQKAAQRVLDLHLVMIGNLRLILLPIVVTHLGMVLVVTVDDTVTHIKIMKQTQAQILAVGGHQIGCHHLHLHLVLGIR